MPDCNEVRKDGSYLYEDFMATEGTDVKVVSDVEECMRVRGLCDRSTHTRGSPFRGIRMRVG